MTMFVRRQLLAAGLALPGLALAQGRARPAPRHRIVRVTATPLRVPITYPFGGIAKPGAQVACYVEVETADGLIGHGITCIVDVRLVAAIINITAGPLILGEDALDHEAIWSKLAGALMDRGQTGLASHALSAIDIALWDIKGKALGQPIATLLGGARTTCPVYVTFGEASLDKDQLVAAVRDLRKRGLNRLKMVVGNGRRGRGDRAGLIEDAARVAIVRDALGPDGDLYLDGNCNFTLPDAKWLADRIASSHITMWEEPILQNDVRLMAELRRDTGLALAAGQNEGQAFRFRDMMLAGAVDYIQPNVMIGGGFTQVVKIAGMAQAFNVPILNGGAGALQNVHVHAGLANGGQLEWHASWMELCRKIYRNIPDPVNGTLTVPDAPGLGIEPDRDAIRAFAAMPWPAPRQGDL